MSKNATRFCWLVLVCIVCVYAAGAYTAVPSGVLDDVTAIIAPTNDPHPLSRILQEWSAGTYTVPGYARNPVPWSPLAATLHDLTAWMFGRTSIVPFRLLNVGVFIGTIFGVYACVKRVSGKPVYSLGCATLVATHPLFADSVPWASDLSDILGTFLLIIGLNVLTSRNTPRGMALTALAFTLCAGFAKPTATINGLWFPVVVLLLGQPKRAVLTIGCAAGVGAVIHWCLYASIMPIPVVRLALGRLIQDPQNIALFCAQLGTQLFQIGQTIGPRYSRMVYVPDSIVWHIATLGYVGTGAVLIAAGAMWSTNRRLSLGLAGIAAGWILGNLPGTLYAMHNAAIGVRYCLMPAICTMTVAAIWFNATAPLLKEHIPTSRINTYAYVLSALALCASGMWVKSSIDRVPFYTAESVLLDEEMRLASEWQLDGKTPDEFRLFTNYVILLAIYQHREAPTTDMCGKLADWQMLSKRLKNVRHFYYIGSTMDATREQIWHDFASRGRCDNRRLPTEKSSAHL